jgi:hypothetical protein
MTTLHLGVKDLPYVSREAVRRKKTGKFAPSMTTGSVAEILEEEYGIMQFFYNKYEKEIGEALLASVKDAPFEAGAPLSLDPFGDATSEIERMFHRFLEAKEMDGAVPGVPTKAAMKGVSKRFKKKKGPTDRPSFIDTGLYDSSFTSWVD